MRHLPTILLILSFPVGIVGYTVASDVLQTMTLPAYVRPFVILFVPLLVAGLAMVPFLIPFIDRKAKADLAAYRATQPAATGGRGGGGDPSPDDESAPPNDQTE
jgi:hypothetical protein